ncbi:DUF924 domain-containing protein [Roseovarius spongiae]|uniref:DUF924 domain-containing protein n=1 Tax=Roseovarius spongiae TaxID=2320272 RepID=A0A3A8AWU0_9RHOB|nr:DUF924 family protein [Roseovarius spongiae]RKF16878.1 DUF924 domain-containing protein [Roseovarius spongiae]
MVTPEDVLSFWLDEIGAKGWYAVSRDLDEKIRTSFHDTWLRAKQGECGQWLTDPKDILAYIILMDQFPRNMFRDSGEAFSTDRHALAAAKTAIRRKWDLRTEEPARQFFYLPLMHSENLCDQERCIRMVCDRMPKTGANTLLHARAHREVIRQFGRFPYRNEALGRETNPPERAYLDAGAYATTVRELQHKDAA